jgi:hypothetical protein
MTRHEEDFAVTVYPKEGRVFAANRDLFVIAEGSTAEEAIEKVYLEARARREMFALIGGEGARPRNARLIPFFQKTAAVALAAIVVLVSADLVAARALADLPRRAAALTFASIDELGQLSQWLSDDRKRELGKSLRILIERMKPAIDEVRPALMNTHGPDAGAPPASGQ